MKKISEKAFMPIDHSNVRLDYCMLCMQKKKGEKNEK
jgi:hypothetical protein